MAADIAPNLYIQTQYHPFELADEDNPATQDYLDVMEQYNPSGQGGPPRGPVDVVVPPLRRRGHRVRLGPDPRVPARAGAADTDWTGGGLHAPQTPGNDTPSPCFLLLSLGPDGFAYEEEATAPTDGLYNCDPENVMAYTGG